MFSGGSRNRLTWRSRIRTILNPKIQVAAKTLVIGKAQIMSGATSSKSNLDKEVLSHKVAIAELNNLSSSRTVYQRNGNLFFRTTIQKATAAEQKQLDTVEARLQKMSSS